MTSLESLKKFQLRSIHGPIYLCLYCAEFKFRGNVNPVKLEEENQRFAYTDESFRQANSKYFEILDSHWVCRSCQGKVKARQMPATSTYNIPSGQTPERFRDLSDVENCLIAPLIVFVKLHNLKNQLTNSKKIVACPISTESVFENLRSLHTDLDLATLVRSAEFDKRVYDGQVRPALLRECIDYLLSKNYRHYGQAKAEELARQLVSIDHPDEFTWLPVDLEEPVDQSNTTVELDCIDQQRVDLGCINTAFLPNSFSRRFAPARNSEVVQLEAIRDPYSQMFPPRFPSGYDIHSNFIIPVTESDWIIHHLRGIDPWFAQNPLFLFTAAYRLDFHKIASSLHAVKGRINCVVFTFSYFVFIEQEDNQQVQGGRPLQ